MSTSSKNEASIRQGGNKAENKQGPHSVELDPIELATNVDTYKLAGDNALGYLELFTDNNVTGVGWSFTNGQGNEYVSRVCI